MGATCGAYRDTILPGASVRSTLSVRWLPAGSRSSLPRHAVLLLLHVVLHRHGELRLASAGSQGLAQGRATAWRSTVPASTA